METTEMRSENSRFHGRHRPRALWIFLGITGFTALAFLFGAIIMWLWNWLMPVIFHLGIITYWQAVGLAILGRLLFGSMHHGGHNHRMHRFGHWRHRNSMGNYRNCRDYSNGARWGYYEQYWNDEGEKAFDEYIKRKTATPAQEK